MITLGSGVFSQNWGKHGEVYVTSCGYKTTKTDPALPNTLWGSVFGFLWAFWGLNTPRNNFGWLGWCTTWSTLLFLPRCGLEEIDASYNPTSALALWGGLFCCCSRGVVVVVVVVQRVLGNHQIVFFKQHHPRDWTWWKFTLFGCVIRGYRVYNDIPLCIYI